MMRMVISCHATLQPSHHMLAGTDEKSIINVLAARSNSQRQEIKHRFKTMFGKVGAGGRLNVYHFGFLNDFIIF